MLRSRCTSADAVAGAPWDARPAVMTATHLLEWLRDGRRVVVAQLVEIEGSAPLLPGATMLIDEGGSVEGSVTGGCVESAIVQLAGSILRDGGPPLLRTFGISDELAGTAGLTCGGTVHVFIHELRSRAAAPTAAFLSAVQRGEPAALATLLDGERAGARLAVVADGVVGSLGDGSRLDGNVADDLQRLLVQGDGAVLRYAADGSKLAAGRRVGKQRAPERHACEQRVHLQAQAPAPQMVVFGAIDFSAALAQLARALGYRVTIADPRAAFARSERFARAADVVVGWPAETLANRALGARDAVLIFSHDPKLDVPAIVAALGSGAGYVGALGSRRTTADRARRLREAGVEDAQLERVFAPCGLDIGSATPEETAIAVLAEIVAHRAGRSGRPLRETGATIRRAHIGPENDESPATGPGKEGNPERLRG